VVLLVDPPIDAALEVEQLMILEEERDLLFAVLRRVGGMDEIAADLDGEIAANGARGCLAGISCANSVAHRSNDIFAVNDHHHDWTRNNILDQAIEEGLALVNRIMTMRQRIVDPHELEAGQLQAALLEPGYNRANQPALHGVGLKDNQRSLH